MSAGARVVLHRVWGRVRWWVSDTWVVAQRYLWHVVHKPDEVIGTLMIPVLTVLLFGFVFGGAMGAVMGAPGGQYREFLMPGLFALTMAFGIGNTTIAVVGDVGRGVVDRFRTMPMAPSALLAGRSVADVVAALVDLTVLLVMGVLIGGSGTTGCCLRWPRWVCCCGCGWLSPGSVSIWGWWFVARRRR